MKAYVNEAKRALNAIRAPVIERDIIKVDTDTNTYIETDEYAIWHVYKREIGVSNDGIEYYTIRNVQKS